MLIWRGINCIVLSNGGMFGPSLLSRRPNILGVNAASYDLSQLQISIRTWRVLSLNAGPRGTPLP